MAGEPANRPSRGMPRKPDPQVLDLEHLGKYSMGDRALEADLLALFRVQARLQAGAIAASDEHESWKLATHTLKGVARTIGAWQVAKIAEALERLGHDGAADERTRLIHELESHIAACEAAIDGAV